MKIFENAINELNLESEQGQALLATENKDLAVLVYNYIKCIALKRGQGLGVDFFKNDATSKTMFGYLLALKTPLGRQFIEERQAAESMFDAAVKNL